MRTHSGAQTPATHLHWDEQDGGILANSGAASLIPPVWHGHNHRDERREGVTGPGIGWGSHSVTDIYISTEYLNYFGITAQLSSSQEGGSISMTFFQKLGCIVEL